MSERWTPEQRQQLRQAGARKAAEAELGYLRDVLARHGDVASALTRIVPHIRRGGISEDDVMREFGQFGVTPADLRRYERLTRDNRRRHEPRKMSGISVIDTN